MAQYQQAAGTNAAAGGYTPPAIQSNVTPGPVYTPSAPPPAPTAAPTAAPTYNYQNAPISDILGSDPWYQQILGADRAASQEEKAWMEADIKRQQAYYGSASDPLSVFGRIQTSYEDALRNVTNMLAAHGTIFSGDLGVRNNRARLEMEQGRLDATMRLQDYITGQQRGFAAAEKQRKFNELQAQMDAVNRWLAMNQPTAAAQPVPAEPGPALMGQGPAIPGYMPQQTPAAAQALADLDAQIAANAAAMSGPPKFKLKF